MRGRIYEVNKTNMQTQYHHYICHKPYGYLSQFITNGPTKKKHKFLGDLHDFAPGTMSIGRLDLQSEGLLLLTTDGKVSFQVLSKKVEKEYYVQVDGVIDDNALDQLRKGVEITTKDGPYTTLPCHVKRIDDPGFGERFGKKVRDDRHGPSSWISITLREGKFRQVRKMTAKVGFPTLRLVRYRIGGVVLNNLSLGEVQEVSNLLEIVNNC